MMWEDGCMDLFKKKESDVKCLMATEKAREKALTCSRLAGEEEKQGINKESVRSVV